MHVCSLFVPISNYCEQATFDMISFCAVGYSIIGANVALLSEPLAFYVVYAGKSRCRVKENHKMHCELMSYIH